MDPIASPPPLVPVMFVKTIFFISILQITAFTLKKFLCAKINTSIGQNEDYLC